MGKSTWPRLFIITFAHANYYPSSMYPAHITLHPQSKYVHIKEHIEEHITEHIKEHIEAHITEPIEDNNEEHIEDHIT